MTRDGESHSGEFARVNVVPHYISKEAEDKYWVEAYGHKLINTTTDGDYAHKVADAINTASRALVAEKVREAYERAAKVAEKLEGPLGFNPKFIGDKIAAEIRKMAQEAGRG